MNAALRLRLVPIVTCRVYSSCVTITFSEFLIGLVTASNRVCVALYMWGLHAHFVIQILKIVWMNYFGYNFFNVKDFTLRFAPYTAPTNRQFPWNYTIQMMHERFSKFSREMIRFSQYSHLDTDR
ncbi:hypothetical protein ABG067_000299 [Albugo candida]|uniref:Uncharacterized protein n=1 Tax=Albugo candida TaxID=65357 RepID=A0A024G896_9STRA|nr:unnamed protein product [Albugo candida]|eukprot:CCI42780.1 unnamed protein product [Albugo candida]